MSPHHFFCGNCWSDHRRSKIRQSTILESVRKVHVLPKRLSMSLIMARRTRAVAVLAKFSKSLAKRRLRLIQARVRSTIHLLAITAKPFWASGRLTISIRHAPDLRTVSRTLGPWYPASAKMTSMNGKRRRTRLVRTCFAPSLSWTLAG